MHNVYESFEPDQKYFYKANRKSGTAGYDKYVFERMAGKRMALFRNARTKALSYVRIQDNTIAIKDRIFKEVIDFFAFEETQQDTAKDEQYYFELEKMRYKYPEYFI